MTPVVLFVTPFYFLSAKFAPEGGIFIERLLIEVVDFGGNAELLEFKLLGDVIFEVVIGYLLV